MRTRFIRVIIAPCTAALLITLAGCGTTVQEQPESERPGPLVMPAAADLTTPESAVESYLDWVGYAYRTADSDVASHTMTLAEGVRVDAYIELNRQDDRAIEQQVTRFGAQPASIEATSALLVASEDWEYRYITMSNGSYEGPLQEASYDATYTLVLDDGMWLVDRVEATPLTPLE